MNYSMYLRLSSVLFLSLLIAIVMSGCGGSTKTEDAASEEEPQVEEIVEVDTEIFPPEAKISGLTYNKVNYDKDNDTYSFEAHATFSNVPSKPKATYKLEYSMDENNVIISDNGKFEGVKPLKKREYYILRVECENLAPVQTEIPSQSLPEIPKISKPSPKEIETKLNDKSAPLLGKSEILNPECKFEFENLEGPNNIEYVQRLYEKIAYDWEGVEVISLDYDEFNRVNKIVMKIIYE